MTLLAAPELRALMILVAALIFHLLAEIFKNVEPDWGSTLISPLRTGVVAGCAGALTTYLLPAVPVPVIGGTVMTLAAAYLERKGLHGEALDGLLTGSIAAFPAATLLVLLPGGDPLLDMAGFLMAGALGGFVISLVASRWSVNQSLVAACVIPAAILIAWLPVLVASNATPEATATAVALLPPAAVFVAVFLRWPALRRELLSESGLGMIERTEIDAASNPLRRLFRGRWADRATRRRFVSVANTLATRKRQQRVASSELQTLHQLEILKLRMELQETYSTHLALERARRQTSPHNAEAATDTIPAKGRPS